MMCAHGMTNEGSHPFARAHTRRDDERTDLGLFRLARLGLAPLGRRRRGRGGLLGRAAARDVDKAALLRRLRRRKLGDHERRELGALDLARAVEVELGDRLLDRRAAHLAPEQRRRYTLHHVWHNRALHCARRTSRPSRDDVTHVLHHMAQ